jgi:hypothetical protein
MWLEVDLLEAEDLELGLLEDEVGGAGEEALQEGHLAQAIIIYCFGRASVDRFGMILHP